MATMITIRSLTHEQEKALSEQATSLRLTREAYIRRLLQAMVEQAAQPETIDFLRTLFHENEIQQFLRIAKNSCPNPLTVR